MNTENIMMIEYQKKNYRASPESQRGFYLMDMVAMYNNNNISEEEVLELIHNEFSDVRVLRMEKEKYNKVFYNR